MGRGKSGYTTNNTPQPQNPPKQPPAPIQQSVVSLDDAKTISDLDQYMRAYHNVRFAKSLEAGDFGLMKNAAEDLDNLLNEFKQVDALGTFKMLAEMPPSKSNAYAYATFGGNIRVNIDKHFTDAKALSFQYAYDLLEKYHPRGTLPRDIVVHEFGHQLERALIQKGLDNGSLTWHGIDKIWNDNKLAKKVIHDAHKNMKRTFGVKTKINDAIADISGYAQKNRSEALAECVADYYRNRNNARPLSQEVWKILKKELG